jgi:GNAT superfamily N-acetyltransferase
MSTSSSIEIRPVASRADRKAFLDLPHELYRNDPAWVPPLYLEQRELITPGKNPFFEHAEAALFLALQDGRPVGRVSAQVDREFLRVHQQNVGFFGFFEAIEDQQVADGLLNAAEQWLRGRGMQSVRGPFTLSINEYAGLLVEGFDTPPFVMMAHHLPYYKGLIEKAGYQKAKDLISFRYDPSVPVPQMSAEVADEVAKEPGLRIREVDKKNLLHDLKIVLDIFNQAWSKNWGFVPLTENEVKKAAKDLSLILEPKLALIAEYNGEPAAIGIAIPDLNEALRDLRGRLFPFGLFKLLWRVKVRRLRGARLTLLGVLPRYRGSAIGRGVSVLLYVEAHRRGTALGLTRGECGWTLEDNEKINRGIEMMGGVPYKRYRVFEKPL